MAEKKLRIGWFSFSCCEDSTIIFTEMLNDHYKEWKQVIDFRSILVLQRKETLDDLDVAFIEGAITSEEQETRLKDIRSKTKKIVAIGNCACSALPSGQRNQFDEQRKKEIEYLLLRFHYAPMVKKVSEVVPIDDSVPGCPMAEQAFLRVLNKYLGEFGIV